MTKNEIIRELRNFIESISVEYFPIDDDDNTDFIYFSNRRYVPSVFDFIKSIKK